MVTTLLILLTVMDVVLLAVVFLMSRRKGNIPSSLMAEITEERHMLNELRESVREELRDASLKIQSATKNINRIAAEVDADTKGVASAIRTELESAASELCSRFTAPLTELEARQTALIKLYKQIDRQKEMLARTVNKGEQITKFFNNKIPYEELLSEIEEKKYDDARALLAKGISSQEIASQLGMSTLEVKLLNASS